MLKLPNAWRDIQPQFGIDIFKASLPGPEPVAEVHGDDMALVMWPAINPNQEASSPVLGEMHDNIVKTIRSNPTPANIEIAGMLAEAYALQGDLNKFRDYFELMINDHGTENKIAAAYGVTHTNSILKNVVNYNRIEIAQYLYEQGYLDCSSEIMAGFGSSTKAIPIRSPIETIIRRSSPDFLQWSIAAGINLSDESIGGRTAIEFAQDLRKQEMRRVGNLALLQVLVRSNCGKEWCHTMQAQIQAEDFQGDEDQQIRFTDFFAPESLEAFCLKERMATLKNGAILKEKIALMNRV